MKFIFLFILFSSVTFAAKDKLAYTPAGAEELSNVFSIAEDASKLFTSSNYIASLKLYANAEIRLSKLMEFAIVDPKKCRKFLLEYNRMKKLCEPRAAKQAYFKLRDDYLADRLNFFLSMSNKNVRTMNILLHKVKKSYDDILKIYSTDEMPKDVPLAPSPYNLEKIYNNFLLDFRTAWVKKFNFNEEQLFAFYQISAATSLAVHTYWLDNAKGEISLPWLQKLYEKLVEQEPYNYGFWFGLGNSYTLQNKIKQANLTWHKSLKYFPDSIYFHYHLANTCGTTKTEIMRAIAHLKWILLNTKSIVWKTKAHYQLAKKFDELSNLDFAYKEILAAADLAKIDIETNNELYSKVKKLQAQILLRLGQKDQALDALKSAAEASPDNINLKLEVANLLTSIANSGEEVNVEYARSALFWYDRILRQNPKTPTVHGSKAFLYLLLGDIDQAQGEAIQEIAIKPDSPATLATLGYTYLAQKNYKSAKIMFKKALDFDPKCSAAIEGLKKIK